MNWPTIISSMTASACLTLAMIHSLIWWQRRAEWSHFFFTLAAVGTAALAGFELALMRAQTPAFAASLLRWGQLPVWLIIVSLAGFAKSYFRTGRPWLLWAICGLRTTSVVLDFVTGHSLYLVRVTAIQTVRWLGQSVSIPIGSRNPWMIVGQLSTWLLVLFVADATAPIWQRGDRQKVILIGGAIAGFLVAGAVQALAVFWWHLEWPITVSLFYLGIVVVMSLELSRDALAAGRLARELSKSQRQMAIADQSHRDKVAHLLRVATLGEISSALAHEVNQPLAAILSNAHAAQRLMAREAFDPAEIREILRDIVSDDQRASAIIRRLRTLLKRGELQLQSLCVCDLITNVLKLMRADLATRSVLVKTDLSPGLPRVWGDPVQLQQVLINLILNAGEAMAENPAGSRTLSLKSSQIEGGFVEICVSDTGPGIPAAHLETIFEPYHTTKAQGLGLGLSLSRSIAIDHGGRLWAEQGSEGGSTLCFTLPQFDGAEHKEAEYKNIAANDLQTSTANDVCRR